MSDDFTAIVLYDAVPVADAERMQKDLFQLEPELPAFVRPGRGASELFVKLPDSQAVVAFYDRPMAEEAAVSSLGMADLPERDRERLQRHRAHAIISCESAQVADPINRLILMLKLGMVLCEDTGMALCIPASGVVLTREELGKLMRLNAEGPRAWGVDESEAALGNYEQHTLWNSLRQEGQPAELLVGFVPAEVEDRTWFFSAGHSLFGLPELAYAEGNIEDFSTVREYFRYLFRHFYRNPGQMRKGQLVPVGGMTLSLESLPLRYREFEATTGTLMVKLVEAYPTDKDWD